MIRQREIDDPQFGRAELCSCRSEESTGDRRSRLERVSNLGLLSHLRFDQLKLEDANRDFREAAAVAGAYAENPEGWLVLVGPSGSGKTHLAAAIANDRIERGEPALFLVASDLLDRLRSTFNSGSDEGPEGSFSHVFEQVRSTPLLVLDALDGVAATEWATEKLVQIVSYRFSMKLPTVVTLHQHPERMDDRLAARLTNRHGGEQVRILEIRDIKPYREVGGMTRARLAEMAFHNFNPAIKGLERDEMDSLGLAYRASQVFAENPQGWLMLQGTNGCGKTHLAAAIANKALAAGTDVFFAVVPDLMDALRSGFSGGSGASYDEIFQAVRGAGLLILDDLAPPRSVAWAEEKLYQIVNYRTLAGLPGVITTYCSLDELDKAFPRTTLRVTDPRIGTFVPIRAPHFIGHRGGRARRA